MAKGLKMSSAKKNGCGERDFLIGQLSKSDNGSLLCSRCRVSIQYISGHTKKSSHTPVAAYLKLWQGVSHESWCSYIVKNAVELLVADSKDVEDADSIFEKKADGSYVFRMNLLVEAQTVAEGLARLEDAGDRSKQFKGKEYVRSGKHLDSYFRSAAGVAKLRSLIEESAEIKELEDRIKIEYKGEMIKWSDFYYDDDSYDKLCKRLERGGVRHPVAISVTVKGLQPVNAAASKYPWTIQCHKQVAGTDTKRAVYIPKISAVNNELQQRFSVDTGYLVVGNIWGGGKTGDTVRGFHVGLVNKAQSITE